jgi:hypothetical protein
VRRARASACASDYAASLGKVPLAITELAGSAAGLAGLATGLGLDLDTLDLLQATVFGGGWVSGSTAEADERATHQLSHEVTSRGRFLCVCESCGASSTKRRPSMGAKEENYGWGYKEERTYIWKGMAERI